MTHTDQDAELRQRLLEHRSTCRQAPGVIRSTRCAASAVGLRDTWREHLNSSHGYSSTAASATVRVACREGA